MKLASFGGMQISIIPHANNPEILSVDIGAENRKEAVSMQTNKDETVDQFCTRIRSMLRSLWNSEPRQALVMDKKEAKKDDKPKTWDEQKAQMKTSGGAAGIGSASMVGKDTGKDAPNHA